MGEKNKSRIQQTQIRRICVTGKYTGKTEETYRRESIAITIILGIAAISKALTTIAFWIAYVEE